MGKRHKHEEHQNHERWVISYADMVTLLFALFVVLYALGQIDLAKLRKLKQSLAFAFHFEGSGKTKDLGIYERGDVGGELTEAAPLINAQKGPMREFLLQSLPREFEEVTGASLEIVQTDDTIAFKAPLSAFFLPGSRRLRPHVDPWLKKLIQKSHEIASTVRIRILAPKRVLGSRPDGTARLTRDLCLERLGYVHMLLGLMPGVAQDHLELEFRYLPAEHRGRGDWEDLATISFAFTNRTEKF